MCVNGIELLSSFFVCSSIQPPFFLFCLLSGHEAESLQPIWEDDAFFFFYFFLPSYWLAPALALARILRPHDFVSWRSCEDCSRTAKYRSVRSCVRTNRSINYSVCGFSNHSCFSVEVWCCVLKM